MTLCAEQPALDAALSATAVSFLERLRPLPRTPRDRLLGQLRRRYDVVSDSVAIGEGTVHLHRVRDIERLIDAIDVLDEDERIPYWAELWPSAVGLARTIARRPGMVRGLRTIELGCGLGLSGIVAAAAGARVLATDYDRDAVAFARLNALSNRAGEDGTGLDITHVVMDWRQPVAFRRFSLVLAADVLYEGRFLVPVAEALDALLSEDGSALVAEPGRDVAAPFFDMLRKNRWRVDSEGVEIVPTGNGTAARVTVYRVRRPRRVG